MLYTLYELQHTAFAPIRFMADQGQQFFRHPMNPMRGTPVGKTMAASCDMVEQLTRRYGKPKFGLEETVIDGKTVAVEEDILCRKPFGQLKHFKRRAHRQDPRVLVVAPMSGHFSTLLRGTVEALLPDHEVFITDWRDARDVPVSEGSFDLDDYVDYIMDWLADLGPNTHVLAVCQPAVPVYAAVSLLEAENHPCAPPTLTMMGGPIDTRKAPTEVNKVATTRPLSWFEEHVITVVPLPNAGFMRRVYPGFLQLAGFMTMNLGDHVMKHNELFEHLIVGDDDSADKTKKFYEEYRSVMDITAEFYLQTIETVFQKHALPRGEWVSRGRRIDPAAIKRTALLAIEGELDDISGVGQTRAALDISTGLDDERKEYFLVPKVGHYGIFNGSRWRDTIAPRVKAFIREFDHALGAKPVTAKKASSTAEAPEAPAPASKKAAATPKAAPAKKAAPQKGGPKKAASKPAAPKAATGKATTGKATTGKAASRADAAPPQPAKDTPAKGDAPKGEAAPASAPMSGAKAPQAGATQVKEPQAATPSATAAGTPGSAGPTPVGAKGPAETAAAPKNAPVSKAPVSKAPVSKAQASSDQGAAKPLTTGKDQKNSNSGS
ncbi:polyhydroxyalkanoate depolymerase [Yunchengibacter salinarum]|uniref:polyhydroxyalkanoate depolymerase n=1 Tax=Yunchengibacter salinarum TaxID=3133399 RepID=UPI0035B651C6